MAIPQINPYDYFHQWREKTNLLATLVGDVETIDVAAADRDTLVEALNKVIGNIGVLSILTTTAQNTIVAAINELDNEMGDLTTLKTTTKSSSVHAINELFDSLLIGDATFTVGSESTDVIRVTVQLKDRSGSNLAIAAGVQAYLSDNADGSTVVATAPSGGWAIGTTGAMIPMVADKAATFICSTSGVFDVDITESGAKTAYLVVILPLGNLKISSAITFAA